MEGKGRVRGRKERGQPVGSMNKLKWKRETSRVAGGHCYRVYDDGGNVVLHTHKQQNCGYWYVFVGADQDEADGTRFRTLWEAKLYAERQVEKGRVSLEAETLTCSECLKEFPRGECTDGVCGECNQESCLECGGTGMADQWDEEDGSGDCGYCGGDGVV
jgi:hypothetical protein